MSLAINLSHLQNHTRFGRCNYLKQGEIECLKMRTDPMECFRYISNTIYFCITCLTCGFTVVRSSSASQPQFFPLAHRCN